MLYSLLLRASFSFLNQMSFFWINQQRRCVLRNNMLQLSRVLIQATSVLLSPALPLHTPLPPSSCPPCSAPRDLRKKDDGWSCEQTSDEEGQIKRDEEAANRFSYFHQSCKRFLTLQRSTVVTLVYLSVQVKLIAVSGRLVFPPMCKRSLRYYQRPVICGIGYIGAFKTVCVRESKREHLALITCWMSSWKEPEPVAAKNQVWHCEKWVFTSRTTTQGAARASRTVHLVFNESFTEVYCEFSYGRNGDSSLFIFLYEIK